MLKITQGATIVRSLAITAAAPALTTVAAAPASGRRTTRRSSARTIDYYDAAHNRIALRHSTWRTAAPGFNAFDFVDFAPFGASNVFGVEVSTQYEDAAGDIHTVGSVEETI